MLKYFYRIGVLLSVVLVFAVASCTDSTKAESSKSGVKVYVAVKYKLRFPAKYSKYDDLLSSATKINNSLEGASYKIDNISDNLSLLISDGKDLASDPKSALHSYIEYLKSQGIVIGVKVVVTDTITKFKVYLVKPSVISDELQANIDAFESIISDLPAVVGDLKTAVSTSVDLAKQCTTLAKSAKTDFTGMDARFAPKAVKSLTDAASQLVKTPAKAKEVIDSVKELIDAINSEFKS